MAVPRAPAHQPFVTSSRRVHHDPKRLHRWNPNDDPKIWAQREKFLLDRALSRIAEPSPDRVGVLPYLAAIPGLVAVGMLTTYLIGGTP